MLDKLIFKLYKDFYRKELLIDGILQLDNIDYKVRLVEEFLKYWDLRTLYEQNVPNMDDLIIELSKKGSKITFEDSDIEYLQKKNKDNIIIELHRNRTLVQS